MARAQFDRNEVIDKSLELFWEHGFNASSMQQVVETTGLKPGSLYLAFGNKEGLFHEALDRYAEKSFTRIHNVLDSAPSVGEGICKHLEAVIQQAAKSNYYSCFLVKTRLELAAEGTKLHEFASSKLDEVEAIFRSYLEKEFEEDLSEQRAASIMLHIFGVRVYGYQKGSVERMRQGVRQGLSWLPWEKIDESPKTLRQ